MNVTDYYMGLDDFVELLGQFHTEGDERSLGIWWDDLYKGMVIGDLERNVEVGFIDMGRDCAYHDADWREQYAERRGA